MHNQELASISVDTLEYLLDSVTDEQIEKYLNKSHSVYIVKRLTRISVEVIPDEQLSTIWMSHWTVIILLGKDTEVIDDLKIPVRELLHD